MDPPSTVCQFRILTLSGSPGAGSLELRAVRPLTQALTQGTKSSKSLFGGGPSRAKTQRPSPRLANHNFLPTTKGIHVVRRAILVATRVGRRGQVASGSIFQIHSRMRYKVSFLLMKRWGTNCPSVIRQRDTLPDGGVPDTHEPGFDLWRGGGYLSE